MLNHYRTLLLNLEDINDTEEHITPAFKPKILPTSLVKIYNILFPEGSSREVKLSLAQVFLNLIDSLNLTSEILLYDPRISYSIKEESNFGDSSFDLSTIMIKLNGIQPFELIDSAAADKYKLLWDTDNSDITKLVAVLLAYVLKINEL